MSVSVRMTEHGHARGAPAKPSSTLPPTRWVGESGVQQIRVGGLQRLQLLEQRSYSASGSSGVVQHV
jgi:hypothetical protein